MNMIITMMVTCQPGQSQMSVCPLWCPLSQWEAGISNHYLGLIEFFFNSKSPKFDVFKSSHWMVSILSWSPPLPLQLCHPQEPTAGGFSARHFLSSWSRPTSLVLVLSISLVIKLKLIFCAVIMFFIILIIIINTNHEKVISTRQFMFGFVQSSFIPYHPHHQHGHHQHGHHQHGHHQHGHHLLLGDPLLLRSTSSR